MRNRLIIRHNDLGVSVLPSGLYDYIADATPRTRVTMAKSPEPLTATDDWPVRVPVTAGELDLFESFFSDILDELFGDKA